MHEKYHQPRFCIEYDLNPKFGQVAPKGCSTVVDHYSTHIDQPKCYSGSFVVNKNLKGICLCSYYKRLKLQSKGKIIKSQRALGLAKGCDLAVIGLNASRVGTGLRVFWSESEI